MAVSKTRNILVDVARQLFARKGLESTTMNDIALASGKGRRTLYTYFKNKEDVYSAVIESELERLTNNMMEVAERNTPPEEKVLSLIYTHLDQIKETVIRNGNLRAEFFRNIWLVERVRKKFDLSEIRIFRRVFKEGVLKGVFSIENVDLIADVAHYCIKGLEVPYICGRFSGGLTSQTSEPIVARFISKALGKAKGI